MSMLANFQTIWMLLSIFIGLERSMMDFFGKNNHLGIIFPASANDVCLTSKLYRMYRKESSARFWLIRSWVEGHYGAIGENRNFGHKLWVFFSTMSHTSHIYMSPKKETPTPNLTFSKIKTLRFRVFPKNKFSKNHIFRPFFRYRVAIQNLFFAFWTLTTGKFIEQKKLGYWYILYGKIFWFLHTLR